MSIEIKTQTLELNFHKLSKNGDREAVLSEDKIAILKETLDEIIQEMIGDPAIVVEIVETNK